MAASKCEKVSLSQQGKMLRVVVKFTDDEIPTREQFTLKSQVVDKRDNDSLLKKDSAFTWPGAVQIMKLHASSTKSANAWNGGEELNWFSHAHMAANH
jgi:hypothetical protein